MLKIEMIKNINVKLESGKIVPVSNYLEDDNYFNATELALDMGFRIGNYGRMLYYVKKKSYNGFPLVKKRKGNRGSTKYHVILLPHLLSYINIENLFKFNEFIINNAEAFKDVSFSDNLASQQRDNKFKATKPYKSKRAKSI